MPPAAPQPTRMRRSPRRSRNARAEARGDAAAELGIAGLEPDRGADAARPDGLRGHDHAAAKRHAPAVQRIGLDRVDFPLRPPARDQPDRDAENDAAGQRHATPRPGSSRAGRQPLPGVEAEQQRCSTIDAGPMPPPPGRRWPRPRRQHDQARLTRPHHGAQAPGYLQLAGNPVDQDGNSVRYRTADRRTITERDLQNVMAHVITH